MNKLILGAAAALAVVAAAAAPNIIWGDAASAATPQPVVTSLTPNSAVAGNPITINGSFADPTADILVQFGTQTAAAPTSVTATSILVTVPPEVGNHGTVQVRVIDSAALPTTSAAVGQSQFTYSVGSGDAQNVYSRLYLTAGGTGNGTHVIQGGTLRVWTLRANGEVVDSASGKCLDATGYGTANGTKLQLWTCLGGSNQRWLIDTHTAIAGAVEIIGLASHKCVDDTAYSKLAGAQQQIWSCHGTDNQLFLNV